MRTLTLTERAVVAVAHDIAADVGLVLDGPVLVDRWGELWSVGEWATLTSARLASSFDESKVSRDEKGRFGEGTGPLKESGKWGIGGDWPVKGQQELSGMPEPKPEPLDPEAARETLQTETESRLADDANGSKTKDESAKAAADGMDEKLTDEDWARPAAEVGLGDSGRLSALNIDAGDADPPPSVEDVARLMDLRYAVDGMSDEQRQAASEAVSSLPVGSSLADQIGAVEEASEAFGGFEANASEGLAGFYTNQWATTSGDSEDQSVAMQIAASEVFGGNLDHFDASGMTGGRASDLAGSQAPYMAAYLTSSHDATLAYYADRNIDEVTLYRGVGLSDTTYYTSGDEVEVEGSPLSSWSTNPDTAQSFANDRQSSDGSAAVVFQATVPVSQLVGTPFTGAGCLGEYEAVVASGGGPLQSTVYSASAYEPDSDGSGVSADEDYDDPDGPDPSDWNG